MKDCSNLRSQRKGNSQVQPSVPNPETPKRNRFYALKVRGEQDNFPDIVTVMLQVFSINV